MKKGWLDKYQTGGKIATNPYEQYVGLNNPNYSSMSFPGQGERVFRGLDNSQPVHITDSTGKQRVLRGKEDTDVFTGKVSERRLQAGGSLNNISPNKESLLQNAISKYPSLFTRSNPWTKEDENDLDGRVEMIKKLQGDDHVINNYPINPRTLSPRVPEEYRKEFLYKQNAKPQDVYIPTYSQDYKNGGKVTERRLQKGGVVKPPRPLVPWEYMSKGTKPVAQKGGSIQLVI